MTVEPNSRINNHSANSLEALFLDKLVAIEKIAGKIAHRYNLDSHDAEELIAEVRFKLINNNYKLLADFQGRSKLETYLYTVINSIFWEWRNKRRGRWRPSAEAKRQGDVAIHLETLIRRDGYRLSEAGLILRTNYGYQVSDKELEEMLARLPRRTQRSYVGEDVLDQAASIEPDGEKIVIEREHAGLGRKLLAALETALGQLSTEDQVILKLQFRQGLKTVAISKSLGIPQKKLYRRIEKVLNTLRKALRASGIQEDPADLAHALRAACAGDGEFSNRDHPNIQGKEES